MKNSVAELESEIRDVFNIPRRRRQLEWRKFVQACSALDVIGDTALALEEYRRDTTEYGQGTTYVLVYGVLQALVLQQDAIKHLSKCISENEIELPEELREIRRIRIWASGHMTESGRKGEAKKFHHMARALMSKDNFRLSTTREDTQDIDFKSFHIPSLIETQMTSAATLLEDLLERLRKDENDHRSKYMSDKLASIFENSIGYSFEKAFQGIRSGSQSDRDLGRASLEHIASIFSGFVKALNARGEVDIANDLRLKEIEYPLQRIESFFEGQSCMESRDAEIFLEYVENRMKLLTKMAEEIDHDYETRI